MQMRPRAQNRSRPWQKTEACLGEIITRLGANYTPSSSGRQGGFDGLARFPIEGNEYLWKFESKCNQREWRKWVTGQDQLQNIRIEDFASKIIDLLAQGRTYWPVVFCLFSPHRVKDAQLLDKIRSLEENHRIPFKISLWDYDYLKSKIPHVLDPRSLRFLYPKGRFDLSQKRHGEVVREFLGDVKQDSVEGVFTKNRYVSVQTQSTFAARVILEVRRESHVRGKQGYVFEHSGRKTPLVCLEDMSSCFLGPIPMRKTVLPHRSAIRSPLFLETEAMSFRRGIDETVIESVDVPMLNRQITEKKTRLVEIMRERIIFDNGISMYDLVKSTKPDSLLVLVRSDQRDETLGHLPFKFLDPADFGANLRLLSFVVQND